MSEPVSGPRPSDRWIPWYFFGFFVLLVLVLVPMCVIAVRTNTGTVTDNPYEKGLAYNKSIAADAQQKSLNWHGNLTLIADEGKLHIDFLLNDAAGKPLDKADVAVWLVRPTQGGMDQKLVMKPEGDGDYHVEIPVPQSGQWEARVSATLDGQNYQASKRVVLP